jgi:hypothetical protein
MKTVSVFEDFDYHAHPRKMVRFHAGNTYSRVLELAAREIERAGAGRIVPPVEPTGDYWIDARHAFQPRKRGTR